MQVAQGRPAPGSFGEPLLTRYSLEVTVKDVPALVAVASGLKAATSVAIAYLPGEALEERIGVARRVRELGFEPKVHLPARRLQSREQLQSLLTRLATEAGLKQVLVIAGDTDMPIGPFADSLAVIETGLLEANGIKRVFVGGHPDGHPAMDRQTCHDWLRRKTAAIRARGMSAGIVTQFGFDADAVLDWLTELRQADVDTPVALGVPGPTSARRLMAFAGRCGVAASASVLRKYGLSLSALMRTTGPDRMIDALEAALEPARHGAASLHFYPFGGLDKTADWIRARQG